MSNSSKFRSTYWKFRKMCNKNEFLNLLTYLTVCSWWFQLQAKVTMCLAKYKPGAQIRTDFTTFPTPQFTKVGFFTPTRFLFCYGLFVGSSIGISSCSVWIIQFIFLVFTILTRSIWKMLGPFATTSCLMPIYQVSPLYCRTPPARRCPRRQRRRQWQRVTEGTAMAPWNGLNKCQNCCLGSRKGIWPVKKLIGGFCCGCLSCHLFLSIMCKFDVTHKTRNASW